MEVKGGQGTSRHQAVWIYMVEHMPAWDTYQRWIEDLRLEHPFEDAGGSGQAVLQQLAQGLWLCQRLELWHLALFLQARARVAEMG